MKLELEPDRVCLVLYLSEDGLIFEAQDTLDYNTKDASFLACIARGLVEMGLKNLDEIIKIGTAAFKAEGMLIEKEPPTITVEGEAVDFPKIEGSA